MIKSILVPVDGSSYSAAARLHAVEIAKQYAARVVGLYVVDVRILETPPFLMTAYPAGAAPPTGLPTEFLEGFHRKAEETLEAFSLAMDETGLEAVTRVEEGVPADVIVELGDSHDLVVIGKRGEHARFGTERLGGIAETVARRTTSPLLLVEDEWRALESVLLLYEGSHASNQALKIAADLALHGSRRLRIFTAASDEEEGGTIQEEARSYLDAFSLLVDYRVREHEPVQAVLELLDEEPCGLVAMGKKSRSVLRNFILGSTSEQLLRELRQPVLLVPGA